MNEVKLPVGLSRVRDVLVAPKPLCRDRDDPQIASISARPNLCANSIVRMPLNAWAEARRQDGKGTGN